MNSEHFYPLETIHAAFEKSYKMNVKADMMVLGYNKFVEIMEWLNEPRKLSKKEFIDIELSKDAKIYDLKIIKNLLDDDCFVVVASGKI